MMLPQQRIIASFLALAVLLTAASLFSAEPAASQPTVRIITDKSNRPTAFEATGLVAADLTKLVAREDAHEVFAKVLSVYVVSDPHDASLPAISGKYSVNGSSLRFTPRYPLRPGMRYQALFCPGEASLEESLPTPLGSASLPIMKRLVTVPAAAAEMATEVTHVYPTAATLPENQLRFYIHFSAPMGRGEAYEHLRLLDVKGHKADQPFLELGEELWDASGRRLTLFIDPGRIKRGLKPREDLGPVLEAGKEYTLVIDRAWRDATGRPLKRDFQKSFRVAVPVESAVDHAAWKMIPPRAGTTEPLLVKFPRPLDHALMERTIWPSVADGRPVAGKGTAADEERRWEFRPESPWKPGKYQLVVDTTLEDLAGNRLGRPFEVEQLGTLDQRAPGETVQIPFEIVP